MHYYTAKGDGGMTGVFGCSPRVRFSKGDGRFEALGGVDELNCFVGWCRSVAGRSKIPASRRKEFLDALRFLQENLFVVQAELGGGAKRLSGERVKDIERRIAGFADAFPPVRSFVVPGATELGAALDITRAVARRVERAFIRGRKRRARAGDAVAGFLNRVSSLLYVLARYVNHAQGASERAPTYPA